jgi:hypothetical protein
MKPHLGLPINFHSMQVTEKFQWLINMSSMNILPTKFPFCSHQNLKGNCELWLTVICFSALIALCSIIIFTSWMLSFSGSVDGSVCHVVIICLAVWSVSQSAGITSWDVDNFLSRNLLNVRKDDMLYRNQWYVMHPQKVCVMYTLHWPAATGLFTPVSLRYTGFLN